MLSGPFTIIDISQPVDETTACFPGDVPFSHELTVSHVDSGVMNLTAFTMSPHVGTHADAPSHIRGEISAQTAGVGHLSLSPYIGPALVVDISPYTDAITIDQVRGTLESLPVFPSRILFKTAQALRYDVFEAQYAWFSVALVRYLAERGMVLIGLDTPSVDHIHSKTLEAHHALIETGMAWLENLDLTHAPEGEYFLSALPLNLTRLEASPVRAVLLKPLE